MRWIQLSDIHMNKVYTDVQSIILQEKLLAFLQGMEMKIDYLFLTGDFRDAGPVGAGCLEDMEKQAKNVADYILKLAEALHLSADKVYLVPGNHDLKRLPEDKDRVAVMRKSYPDYRQSFEPDERRYLLGRFAFFERIEALVHPQGEQSCWAEHRFYSEKEADILCLNTAMSSYDQDELGTLMLDTGAIYQLVKNPDSKEKPILVLAHHGLDYWLPKDKENLQAALKNRPVFYLCGHSHKSYHDYTRSAKWCDITVGTTKYAQDNDYLFAVGHIGAADVSFEVAFYRYNAVETMGWEYTGKYSFQIGTMEQFFQGIDPEGQEGIYLPLIHTSDSTEEQRARAIRTLRDFKVQLSARQSGKFQKIRVRYTNLPVNAGILIGYALHSRQNIQLEFELGEQVYTRGGKRIVFEREEREAEGAFAESVPLCVYIQAKQGDTGKATFEAYLQEKGLAGGQRLYLINVDHYDESFDLGASAEQLVNEIEQGVERLKQKGYQKVQVHLFYNGFWGLALFLGHHLPMIYSIQLYDYDGNNGATYQESFCLRAKMFEEADG